MNNKNILVSLLTGLILIILMSISASATLNNTAFAGFIAPINNSIVTGTVLFNFTLNSSTLRTEKINISVVNYTMVSVDGGAAITFCTNVTGGAATANVTSCSNNTALFPDGVYNVTIHIANQTSALTGTPNSTTALAGVNISIENFGPKIIITSPGNATAEISTHVINNTILLDANFLNREFEINFSLRDNTAAQNRSFFCELHVIKNIGSPTAIGGGAALSSFILNKTLTFSNATNVTFKVPSSNVLLNGSNSTFQVKCRNSEQSALYNLSFLQTLTVSDVVRPFNVSKPTFKDTNGVEKTKFEFGDKITIKDCTGTDNVDEAVQKNITIKFPGISGFGLNNITLSFEDTLAIGTYTVNCSISDSSGGIDSNSSDFEIISKVRETSVAAIKGPKPVSKGIVGKDSSESVEVTAEGVGRLVSVGGSLKFMVNNEEHSVTVKEVGKDSVALTISSTPFDISLTKGDAKDVDVDGDGTNDVNVKFNGVFYGKADITLTVIAQPVKEAPIEKAQPTAQERVAEAAKKITTGTNAIWFVIIVVVIIAIVGYLLVSRKK